MDAIIICRIFCYSKGSTGNTENILLTCQFYWIHQIFSSFRSKCVYINCIWKWLIHHRMDERVYSVHNRPENSKDLHNHNGRILHDFASNISKLSTDHISLMPTKAKSLPHNPTGDICSVFGVWSRRSSSNGKYLSCWVQYVSLFLFISNNFCHWI